MTLAEFAAGTGPVALAPRLCSRPRSPAGEGNR